MSYDLFRGTDPGIISLESYAQSFSMTETTSLESISGFFSSARDTARNIGKALIPVGGTDVAYNRATKNMYAVRNKVLDLDNHDLYDMVVVIPEAFKGNFHKLILDTTDAYVYITDALESNMKGVIKDLGKAINNSDTDTFTNVSMVSEIRKLRKSRLTMLTKIKSYFPVSKSKAIARLSDIYRTPTDISNSYEALSGLDKAFRSLKTSKVLDLSKTLYAQIDSIVEILETMDINDKKYVGKDISEVISELAEAMTFFGYLQGIMLQIFNTVEKTGEVVLQYKKKK